MVAARILPISVRARSCRPSRSSKPITGSTSQTRYVTIVVVGLAGGDELQRREAGGNSSRHGRRNDGDQRIDSGGEADDEDGDPGAAARDSSLHGTARAPFWPAAARPTRRNGISGRPARRQGPRASECLVRHEPAAVHERGEDFLRRFNQASACPASCCRARIRSSAAAPWRRESGSARSRLRPAAKWYR